MAIEKTLSKINEVGKTDIFQQIRTLGTSEQRLMENMGVMQPDKVMINVAFDFYRQHLKKLLEDTKDNVVPKKDTRTGAVGPAGAVSTSR